MRQNIINIIDFLCISVYIGIAIILTLIIKIIDFVVNLTKRKKHIKYWHIDEKTR